MKLIKEISFHQVLQVWLKTEWYHRKYDNIKSFIDLNVLATASPQQQAILKTIMFLERGTILNRLPYPKTRWYVARITQKEFLKFNIINENTWFQMFRGVRNISKVAKMFKESKYVTGVPGSHEHLTKIMQLIKNRKKYESEALILIQNEKSVKRTILEGNHRAISFAVAGRKYLPKNVVIGISEEMNNCIWHI